jgi:hypothetical protein
MIIGRENKNFSKYYGYQIAIIIVGLLIIFAHQKNLFSIPDALPKKPGFV